MNLDLYQQAAAAIAPYSPAFGVNVAVLTADGSPAVCFGAPCQYCLLFQQHMGEYCSCQSVHSQAGHFAANFGDCYFYFCSAGMVHFAVALAENGHCVGSVSVGPLKLEWSDEAVVDSVCQKYNLTAQDKPALLTALNDVPLFEPKKVHFMGKLLFNMIYQLLENEDKLALQQKGEAARQQAQIGKSIKDVSQEVNLVSLQLAQERKLTDCLIRGDIEGAQQQLNDVIGRLYFSLGNNQELIKIRMAELMGLLSRVAIQTGSDPAAVHSMVDEFQRSMVGSDDLAAMSQALAQVLRRFIDLARSSTSEGLIEMSRGYIERNLHTRVTMEDAARYVALSPAYFSRLFKEKTGKTFSLYVNERRIEQAKRLLRKSELSLAEIAQQLGFENQQYFSRVFKKYTGSTPGQYRTEGLH